MKERTKSHLEKFSKLSELPQLLSHLSKGTEIASSEVRFKPLVFPTPSAKSLTLVHTRFP